MNLVRRQKYIWCYFGSLMEVSRSHTFASWFSRSIKYMSPEISTTIPTPLGICTLSLSLGLQTSMESLGGSRQCAYLPHGFAK